jgi:hypothetical protein
MITTAFFLCTILFIVYEVVILLDPDKLVREFNMHKELNVTHISISSLVAVNALYTVWVIIGGIFSAQYITFIVLFLLGFISYFFKRNKNNNQVTNIIIIDSLVSIVLLSSIVYKHFYV